MYEYYNIIEDILLFANKYQVIKEEFLGAINLLKRNLN
jgi:hypothetical protein